MRYTDINSETIDGWAREGWIYARPVDAETCRRAREGDWCVILTPTRRVPAEWLGDLKGKRVLGLACGGGQQMPLFAIAGAECTVLDYSQAQLNSEKLVAEREGYDIQIVRADMSLKLPFEDEQFDMIFHPVSNCYIEYVEPLWRECRRVLKPGGRLLAGMDNSVSYAYDDTEKKLKYKLPFNPLKDPKLYRECIRKNWGIQFSHTIDEQVGGQLRAGFELKDIYQDTSGNGALHDYGVPTFIATYAVKRPA